MATQNLLKDSKAYYENNDYYEIFSIAEDAENKVSNYLKELVKNKIVLDAGCGTGKFLNVLENSSSKYIGIDLSNYQLDKAKKKSSKITSEFICSNLANIPLNDHSVDLIISTWVLGTIIDLDEREKCLKELKRVLKPNGTIILVENDENSEFEELRNRIQDRRTRDYNNWILSKCFVEENKINTYFDFESIEIAKKCFEIIYGDKIASKINNNEIEHKIIIFKYVKND